MYFTNAVLPATGGEGGTNRKAPVIYPSFAVSCHFAPATPLKSCGDLGSMH